ncbi:hypothetical protein RRG08_063552 [Elysia crispata]|uniref:4Fe-4S ferredoxin-type domain-containing protein n=1 Tax=Elysia crispata TaxID=231223 RepID=A0AAE0YNZ9_9GAST|nr:hypothetical protein RRG08_063552 [Elysia crispata]
MNDPAIIKFSVFDYVDSSTRETHAEYLPLDFYSLARSPCLKIIRLSKQRYIQSRMSLHTSGRCPDRCPGRCPERCPGRCPEICPERCQTRNTPSDYCFVYRSVVRALDLQSGRAGFDYWPGRIRSDQSSPSLKLTITRIELALGLRLVIVLGQAERFVCL